MDLRGVRQAVGVPAQVSARDAAAADGQAAVVRPVLRRGVRAADRTPAKVHA